MLFVFHLTCEAALALSLVMLMSYDLFFTISHVQTAKNNKNVMCDEKCYMLIFKKHLSKCWETPDKIWETEQTTLC